MKCEFPLVSTAEWKQGKAEASARDQEFTLHFDALDFKDGKARLIGNKSAADVVLIPSSEGLSFIERTPGGNLMLTTVFPWKPALGDFVAVTSRHLGISMMNAAPIPSQAYGYCNLFD